MSERKGKHVTCHMCGKVIWASPSTIVRNEAATGRFFCSRACSKHWRYETDDGFAYFSKKFKETAALGSLEKAHAKSRGKPSWNKGLTAQDDERVKGSAAKRMKTVGGPEGLARRARRYLIKHDQTLNFKMPEHQRRVLEMVKRLAGSDQVSSEHLMVLNGEFPVYVDIVVPSVLLAIEVDGKDHNLTWKKLADEKRDQALSRLGWRVLRIKNSCVDEFPETVEEAIRKALRT